MTREGVPLENVFFTESFFLDNANVRFEITAMALRVVKVQIDDAI